MRDFHAWTMRNASAILFVMALLIFCVGFFPNLVLLQQSAHDLYGDAEPMKKAMALNAFAAGLGGAVWPLFGSALLWRVDLFRAMKAEAAE